MSATVAAIAKKLAVMLATDKRTWKVVGIIVGMLLFIALMPAIVLLAMGNSLSSETTKTSDFGSAWLSLSAEQGNEYAQNLLSHMNDFDNAMLANTVMSLFVNLSRCIGEDLNQKFQSNKLSVDRKLRRVIQEKKMAMGIRENQLDEMEYR